MGGSWSQRAPLFGALAVVLFVIAVIVGGSTPDGDETSQKVVSFYTDHDSKETLSSILAFYGVVALAFFIGALRPILRRIEGGSGTLSATSFGGGIVLVLGLLVFAGLSFVLADLSDKLDPAAAQAINALNGDFFFPVALGTGVFLIPAGIVWRKADSLPSWLGWAAIVIGILAFTPAGFFSFLAALLWIAVVGVYLTVRPVAA